MRVFRLYAVQTFKTLCRSFRVSAGVALFVSVSSWLFLRAVGLAEGRMANPVSLWAESAAWTLPWLASFSAMGLVADDRRDGRIELLLSSPMPAGAYAAGRFAGLFAHVLLAIAAFLAVPLVLLPKFAAAGSSMEALSLAGFMPAYFALACQAAAYCAIGLLASACTSRAAVAFAGALACTALAPYGIYLAAFAWSPYVRAALPSFPPVWHASEASVGTVRMFPVAVSALVAAWAVPAAARMVSNARFAGCGHWWRRAASFCVSAAGLVFCVLAAACARRLDFPVSFPGSQDSPVFSARTLSILADTHGETRATCFMSRSDPSWGGVARLMRAFETAARNSAGMRLTVDFVDPSWDLSAAVRIARSGVKKGCIVFERGRRRISIPAAEANEPAIASALLRLSLPAGRDTLYWTSGHGEADFGSYEPLSGMSSIARLLRQDGYALKKFDMRSATAVPDDCAALVSAGAKTPFSAAENAMVDAYLRKGGRMLVLVSPETRSAGAAALLEKRGVRIQPFTVVSPRTLDGSDIVACCFGDHATTRPLAGSSLVFRDAAPIETVTADAAGVDAPVFTDLVRTDAAAWGESGIAHRPWTHDAATEPAGPLTLAVAVECGIGKRTDIAVRPSRMVVVGDASFAVDAALESRANANADFFRNALAWLAGLDAYTAPGVPADVLRTGLDRDSRMRLAVTAVLAWPALMLLAAAAVSMRGSGRRKSA